MKDSNKIESKTITSQQKELLAKYSKKAQAYMIWLDQTYKELTEIRNNYRKSRSEKL